MAVWESTEFVVSISPRVTEPLERFMPRKWSRSWWHREGRIMFWSFGWRAVAMMALVAIPMFWL